MAKAKIFLLFLLSFTVADTFSQNYISPYSRYGLGDLNSNHLLRHRAMGGTSIAAADSTTHSLSNPASFAELQSFVLETGFSGTLYNFKINDKSYSNYDFELPYLSFSLPLLPQSKKHNWGINMALTPFSKTGYQSVYSSTNIVKRDEFFNGTGGFSKFSFGSGIKAIGFKIPMPEYTEVVKIDSVKKDTLKRNTLKFVKRQSKILIGANVGYLFGQQILNHALVFKDTSYLYRLDKSTRTIAGGFVYDAGIIWKTDLSDISTLQLGANFNLQSDINARQEIFANTIKLDESGVSDSVFASSRNNGKITLPMGYGGGIQYTLNKALDRETNKDNLFTIAFDYTKRNWADYRIFGNADSIRNYSSFSGGIEWKPNSKVSESYFRKIKYRFGGKIANGIYNLNDIQPVDQSFSFGVGMPFSNKQSSNFPSYLDLTIEAGQIKSAAKANSLQQQYIIFSVGIHLLESSWYNRNKID